MITRGSLDGNPLMKTGGAHINKKLTTKVAEGFERGDGSKVHTCRDDTTWTVWYCVDRTHFEWHPLTILNLIQFPSISRYSIFIQSSSNPIFAGKKHWMLLISASKEAKADAEDHLQQVDGQHLVHLELVSSSSHPTHPQKSVSQVLNMIEIEYNVVEQCVFLILNNKVAATGNRWKAGVWRFRSTIPTVKLTLYSIRTMKT